MLGATGGTKLINQIRAIFGTYTPTDSTSLAGADWEYILTFVLFIVITYSILRILGSLFK